MKLSSDIRGPIDSARAVLARRETILAHTDKTRGDLAAAEAKLQAALEALATQAAAAAMGESPAPDNKTRRAVRLQGRFGSRQCANQGPSSGARPERYRDSSGQRSSRCRLRAILRRDTRGLLERAQISSSNIPASCAQRHRDLSSFWPSQRVRGFDDSDPRRESEPLIPVVNRVHTGSGWTDDLQPDAAVASVRAAFEELQRESKRITTERQAAELARASAEAEAKLAGGPQYQARAVGDYSGPPKYYGPAAERQAQAAAKPN